MITYVDGDLFSGPAQVLVNTVNTVGVMGKGIAYDFKRIYPKMFEQYQDYCARGVLDIGKLWLYKTPQKWILNFPTKKQLARQSKVEYIELDRNRGIYDSEGIKFVRPMLGLWQRRIDWDISALLMEKYEAAAMKST